MLKQRIGLLLVKLDQSPFSLKEKGPAEDRDLDFDDLGGTLLWEEPATRKRLKATQQPGVGGVWTLKGDRPHKTVGGCRFDFAWTSPGAEYVWV